VGFVDFKALKGLDFQLKILESKLNSFVINKR